MTVIHDINERLYPNPTTENLYDIYDRNINIIGQTNNKENTFLYKDNINGNLLIKRSATDYVPYLYDDFFTYRTFLKLNMNDFSISLAFSDIRTIVYKLDISIITSDYIYTIKGKKLDQLHKHLLLNNVFEIIVWQAEYTKNLHPQNIEIEKISFRSIKTDEDEAKKKPLIRRLFSLK